MNRFWILFSFLCVFLLDLSSQKRYIVNDGIEEIPILHSDGAAWGFYVDSDTSSMKKKVLFIGDSILGGYKKFVKKHLADKAVVDFWLTPIHEGAPNLFSLLSKISSYRDYDIIHFNIGLHGWPEGRVAEENYVTIMTNYVKTLRRSSPHACLIWSSTTPVLKKNVAELDSLINPIIEKRNVKAYCVMKKNGVLIIDLYSKMLSNLSYGKGDAFHWTVEGQKIQANEILDVLDVLL